MDNKIQKDFEDEKIEQTKKYLEPQNGVGKDFLKSEFKKGERNEDKGVKKSHLMFITFVIPLIYFIGISSDELNAGNFLFYYLTALGIVIYFEGLFIYFIKKIIPGVNRIHIRILITFIRGLAIISGAKPGSSDGLLLFTLPFVVGLFCAIGYVLSYLVEMIVILIKKIKKGENVFKDCVILLTILILIVIIISGIINFLLN